MLWQNAPMSNRKTRRRGETPPLLQFAAGGIWGCAVGWLGSNLEWLPVVLGGALLAAAAAWLLLKCLAAVGAILRG